MENQKVFNINEDVLKAIDDYNVKSNLMQRYYFEFNPDGITEDQLKEKVNDDLVFNVRIYDMLDRRYAAFSSFIEAIKQKDNDPKKNGKWFNKLDNMPTSNWIMLYYLFRLTGSGINYKPKSTLPFGSHGFGNCWLVERMLLNDTSITSWLKSLSKHRGPYTDSKGYLLPQISYKHLNNGHLKHFILTESEDLMINLYNFITEKRRDIIECVDFCNDILVSKGFKRQSFVLSATMADISEYHPELINPNSMIYAGTNAKRCINLIFSKSKKVSNLEYESACIQFLADRYNSTPYSVEDSRLCDVVRYFNEYQSKHHILQNNNVEYKNSSILKEIYGENKYYEFVKSINKKNSK